MTVKWVPVKGYEGHHEISSDGKVRSVDRFVNHGRGGGKRIRKGQPLTTHVSVRGYISLRLKRDGVSKLHTLHRLLAIHFLPNPDNLPAVNHIDGNKLNNDLSNLEWCSNSHNNQHAYDTGLKSAPKKPVLQLDPITDEVVATWPSAAEAAKALNGTKTYIRAAISKSPSNLKFKTAYGFKWEYGNETHAEASHS